MPSNQQGLFEECRKRWPCFYYEDYTWQRTPQGLALSFRFSIDAEHRFCPTALIEQRQFLNFDCSDELLDLLVFNIGMIELVSYWKCTCAPTVVVQCGRLSDSQLAFWKKTYWNGLGEFFYTNGIRTTIDRFMHIECCGAMLPKGRVRFAYPDGYLVPVGGGKDSVVSLEVLRSGNRLLRPLIMNPRGATIACARQAGFDMDDVLVIRRTIHPLLLDMNAQGFLNGHTPFSAMLAFYTLLASVLSGMPHIALSNESSASEPTVYHTHGSDDDAQWQGVNHQYSKSLEFEDDFRAYVATLFETEAPDYFSLLRPLSELAIARLFASVGTRYHAVFRSCNVGSKQDIWCGHCPKCLFAYIILSPFLKQDYLVDIFGHNLLDDEQMRLYFDQLVGAAPTKPFECVGTVSEVNTALALLMQTWPATCPLPLLLQTYTPQPPDLSLFELQPCHNLSQTDFTLLQSLCSVQAN